MTGGCTVLWLPLFLLVSSILELGRRITSPQAELGIRLVTAILELERMVTLLPWRLMVQDMALAHSLQVLNWQMCNQEHDFPFIITLTKVECSFLWPMLSCLTSSVLNLSTSVVWLLITLAR